MECEGNDMGGTVRLDAHPLIRLIQGISSEIMAAHPAFMLPVTPDGLRTVAKCLGSISSQLAEASADIAYECRGDGASDDENPDA